MLGELIPLGGGDPIPLLKPKLMIGRRESCDIALRFPNVSSHHCRMEFLKGYWCLFDLGSSNGTKVNGIRIRERWLYPGDEVSVAKHNYRIEYVPQGNEPPPQNDEDITVSLLEKAGLERSDRPRRPSRPATKPPAAPRTPSDAAEDDAFKWLQDSSPEMVEPEDD